MIREMERIFEELKDDFNRKINQESLFNIFTREDSNNEEYYNNSSTSDSYENIDLNDATPMENESVEEIPSIEEETISLEISHDGFIDNEDRKLLMQSISPPEIKEAQQKLTESIDPSEVENGLLNEEVPDKQIHNEEVPDEQIQNEEVTNEKIQNEEVSEEQIQNEDVKNEKVPNELNNPPIAVVIEDYSSPRREDISEQSDSSDSSDYKITEKEEYLEIIKDEKANSIVETKSTYDHSDSATNNVSSAKKFVRETFRNHSSRRIAWLQMQEVQESGYLQQLSNKEIQLQEAMFEIITSEAAYYKSLMVLTTHFFNSELFTVAEGRETVVSAMEKHHIFSNIILIMSTSQKFLSDLEDRWNEEKPLLKQICDILLTHSKSADFQNYVTYLRNQQYQIEALKRLRESESFRNLLKKLETSPECGKLSLDSYLMLPMQRLTRLRMLVESIIKIMNSEEIKFKTLPIALENAEKALVQLKKLLNVSEFEKGVMDQKTVILSLMNKIDFPFEIKRTTFSNKLFVKEDSFKIHPITGLKTLRKITKKKHLTLTLFLFNDLLIITKKKGPKYRVVDYAARDRVLVQPINPSVSINDLSYSPIASTNTKGSDTLFKSESFQNSVAKDQNMLTQVGRSKTTISAGSTSSQEERKRFSNPLASSLRSLPSVTSKTDNESESRNISFSLELAEAQTDIFSTKIVLICPSKDSRDEWVSLLNRRGSISKDTSRLHKSLSLNVKASDTDQYKRSKKFSLALKSDEA